MATRPVAKVLNARGGRPHTSLDAERETFEKNQITSITKAICSQECPVKQKHVRGMYLRYLIHQYVSFML